MGGAVRGCGGSADADAALGFAVDVVCDGGEEVEIPILRDVPVEGVEGVNH